MMEKLKEALDQREEISNVESMEWCEDGQIDEDAIYDDACEAAEELAVFLRAVFNNPKEDSKKLIKFLDNLWTAGKYKQLQATLIGFELLFEFPEKYLEDVECCLGEARKLFLFAI